AEAVAHEARLPRGIQADAAVALLLREVEVAAGASEHLHGVVEILEAGLDLLDAADMGPLAVDPFQPALAGGGTDAVKILGDHPQHPEASNETVARVYSVRRGRRRAEIRRVQDQGGAALALLLQRRPLQRRPLAGPPG